MADPEAALDELKRLRCERSLKAFVQEMWHELEPGTPLVMGWVMDAICEALEQVEQGNIKRLLINVPPGFMKSMLTSVFFPAWLWGPRKQAHKRIISTSYAQDLAIRDNRRARELIESESYQKWWGVELSGDQNAKIRYENTERGFRQAASTGSALTGHRGDGIIVDDPHSVESSESEADRNTVLAWFGETLPTRFNNQKEGWLIVIMQRLHQQDVSGFILGEGEGEEALSGYVHLMIPMEYEPERHCSIDLPSWKWEDPRTEDGELAWEERFDRDDVEGLKEVFRKSGGEYAVAGQLQQSPVPRDGGMFQKQDFQIIDASELPPFLGTPCRGWDLAATKDGHGAQTAGVKGTMVGGNVYILDAVAGRWGPNEVTTQIKLAAKQDGYGVVQSLPQDPGQAGKAQKSFLGKELVGYDFHFTPESGSKEDRARPLSSVAEAGNLYVVRGPWNDSFIGEMCSFPSGKLKDQVDAASRMFQWLISRGESYGGHVPEVI